MDRKFNSSTSLYLQSLSAHVVLTVNKEFLDLSTVPATMCQSAELMHDSDSVKVQSSVVCNAWADIILHCLGSISPNHAHATTQPEHVFTSDVVCFRSRATELWFFNLFFFLFVCLFFRVQ